MHAQGLPPAGQPLAGEVTARWLTSKWQIQMLMQNGNYLSLHAEVVPRGYFKTLRVTAISPAVQMPAACIVAERFQFSLFASWVGLAVLAWMLHFYSQWLPFPYSCFTSSFLQSSEKAAALIHSSPFFCCPLLTFLHKVIIAGPTPLESQLLRGLPAFLMSPQQVAYTEGFPFVLRYHSTCTTQGTWQASSNIVFNLLQAEVRTRFLQITHTGSQIKGYFFTKEVKWVKGLPQICIFVTWLAQNLVWVSLPVSSVIQSSLQEF